MKEDDKAFQQALDKEFLKHLHKEKLKTQAERAKYIFSKLAFITGLFGLGSLKIGNVTANGVFFLIPVIVIGYDLYINAADSSIKKIGAFLGKNNKAGSGDSEKAWEKSSGDNRDKIAPLASCLLSFVATIGAWKCFYDNSNVVLDFSLMHIEKLFSCNNLQNELPIVWLISCLGIIICIHVLYSGFIKKIDQSYPDILEWCSRENKRWRHF